MELENSTACARRRDPTLSREQAEVVAILFDARVVGRDDVGVESLGECLVRMDVNQKCLADFFAQTEEVQKNLGDNIKSICDRVEKLESIIDSIDRRKERTVTCRSLIHKIWCLKMHEKMRNRLQGWVARINSLPTNGVLGHG